MSLLKRKSLNLPNRRLSSDTPSTKSGLSEVFRRNQTLVNAAMPGMGSPRAHTHHLTIRRRKIASVFLIVFLSALLLFFLIINFTANAVVNVSNTEISKSVDLSIYEKTIQNYLDTNPMERFSFLLNKPALSAYVSDKLTEVKSVNQQGMSEFGKTGFSIEMRAPVAGWVIDGKQYYVDSMGVSFEKNYFSQPDVQVVDESGASLKSGTAIVSKRFLSFVGRIVSLSKDNGYTIAQAILPANTTRELQVRVKEGNYLVKLSIDRAAGEQIEDMSRAVKYFNDHGQTPSYIDVRVSGKAFYK